MADNTEWFEALTIEEAKEERLILRLWFGRVAALAGFLAWWRPRRISDLRHTIL
jgi:hypothetical protein